MMLKKLSQMPFGLHLLIAAYVLCVLFANITLNNFIDLPVYGMLSVGTIFFAAIFTLRDRIHAAGGLFPVYFAIAMAVIVNTVVAYILDTPPRFIIASFVAILCSELADTAIFHRMRYKSWAARVLGSNAISVPLDSVLFGMIAFYGLMETSEVFEIIYADIVVKYLISVLFIVRWRLVGKEKKVPA